MNDEDINPQFETLLDYLTHSRGFDFGGYKRTSLMRRVLKRVQSVKADSFTAYQDYLEVHPEEFTTLFNTILINVTSFFRDESAWKYLAESVLPKLVNSKDSNEPIRIWSAGCSSGEEAYSLAILLSELLGAEGFRKRVKIYATDADEEALNQARQGSYPAVDVLKSMPPALVEKYFEKYGQFYTFHPELRRSIIFGRHDLLQDAPISRLNLLVCRNTLMYLNVEAQARILDRFYFALQDGGYLFLGKAEMLFSHARLFIPLELKHRIFSKVITTKNRLPLVAPLDLASTTDSDGEHNQMAHLQEVAFDTLPLAQVIVGIEGHLLRANERARSLFNLNIKDIGRPLQDLELSYRPAELRSLIDQAYNERRPISLSNVERILPGGIIQYLDLLVAPLPGDKAKLMGVSITFTDVSRFIKLKVELNSTRQELETAYEELQSTNEELQTTNEELQSTVEELETTNEELQSTNEEMETMNEELQSTNAELQTLNDELQQRTESYLTANLFLQSILVSVQMGVVAVDKDFNVRIWNKHAEELWGLREEEVKGQSLLSLDIGLPVEQLTAPLLEVMSGKSVHPELMLAATNRRGQSIHCRITCTALNESGKERQGAVILMEEVSIDT